MPLNITGRISLVAIARVSGEVIKVSGEVIKAEVSGDVVKISGETIRAKVSGDVVKVSGETLIAKVSGDTVIGKISGEAVKISGDTIIAKTSGEVLTVTPAAGVYFKVIQSGATDIYTPTEVKTYLLRQPTLASGGVVLHSGATRSVIVKAVAISGDIYVGGATNRPYSGFGLVLQDGEATSLDVNDFNKIYIVSTGSGMVSFAGVD